MDAKEAYNKTTKNLQAGEKLLYPNPISQHQVDQNIGYIRGKKSIQDLNLPTENEIFEILIECDIENYTPEETAKIIAKLMEGDR